MSILRIWKESGKILEGIANSVFTKEHVEQAAEARTAICKECPEYREAVTRMLKPPHCGKCGCIIHAKTRSLSSSCPLDKWPALLDMEEEYQLNQSLHSKQ